MLNFTYKNGELIAVSTECTRDAINRNDIIGMAHAEKIAQEATTLTGKLHVACDRSASTSPRYDVIEAPTVGSEVSRGFNGDYYPAGMIVKVSSSLRRVVTDTGVVFYRRRQSDTWVSGGMWCMVAGRHDRLNPSF